MDAILRNVCYWLCALALATALVTQSILANASEYPSLDPQQYKEIDTSVAVFYDWWGALSREQQDSVVKDLAWFGVLNTKPGESVGAYPPKFPGGTIIVWVDDEDIWIACVWRNGILWLVQPVDRDNDKAFYPRLRPPRLEEIISLYSALNLTKHNANSGLNFSVRQRQKYTYWDFVNQCDLAFGVEYGVNDGIKHINLNMMYLDMDMQYFHYVFLTTHTNKTSYKDYTLNDMHAIHMFSDGFFDQSENELAAYSGDLNYQTSSLNWSDTI